ncbi:Glucans biosynthesis protein D precursor [Marinomonas spartinae]|uniref:glucan biosynthesis protein n=1 Tax=Marinomonas spartinae TaxID=1792290 RepID=UPI000808B35A|nr:glucan biosynthesis protein D [Marinomonas spartinae]SBS30568.1 Glucans biosynthesis protein D precursor [Marinomonas spartinae]
MPFNCIDKTTKASLSVTFISTSFVSQRPYPRFQRLASRVLLAVSLLVSVTTYASTPQVASDANSVASSKAANPPGNEAFSYAWLKGYARHLSSQPYHNHQGEVPSSLKDLSWNAYQQIRYKDSEALWRTKGSLFHTEFFHLGRGFDTPVHMNEIKNGKVIPIDYSPSMFDYGKSKIDAKKLSKDLGFAGFRMQFATDWKRDVVAFLGASYFRAVGSEMQYGLSARGLAVDTALDQPEEFPVFTNYWLEKPKPGSSTVTVYALMESKSVSGAYRFDITPGEPLKMKVDAAIYPRKSIERLGIAPLTSMYMVGENDRRTNYDWREEIHDSDGLAMHTGSGEWIWRPLTNPKNLRFNAYSDDNPKGFGLLQRDRNFDHYQDDSVFYEKRPSLWIEPIGNWGKGSVDLVEIPTLDETFDNIVAFWHPAQPIKPGQELLYSYNMYWGSHPPQHSSQARVQDTFTGIGGVIGQKRHYYSKRFVIDFAGGDLPMIGDGSKLKAVIHTSKGKVELESVRPINHSDKYRVMFDVVPPDATDNPIDMQVYLDLDGKRMSETWSYQWNPPLKKNRELHNAGHLN